MNILVCIKRVPAPGARINITEDGQAVDTAFLGFTVSPHEECAIEAAVQLVEKHGGAVTVLTLGPLEAEEQLRAAVSVGASRAVLIAIEGPDWDPQRTARGISTAITRLESTHGIYDLILFGNESADSCGYQVGIRIAVNFGRPIVNGAKTLDIENGVVTIQRAADGGQELYTLPLPACVGVREGINLPRYPTMKGRLASKKVDLERVVVDETPGGQRMIELRRPPEKASTTVILGTGPEAAPTVVDLLEKLGVLS